MADDRPENQPSGGLLGMLLSPLRAPQRVFGDVESIARALLALQHDIGERLASIDLNAQRLASGLGDLQAPLDRIDHTTAELPKLKRAITERMDAQREDLKTLQQLEQAVTDRMDTIRDELHTRMLAVEQDLRVMHTPIEQISRDVAQIVELLPDPSTGPLARLKDTLSSS